MEESEKENLFRTFKSVIESIIFDKRRNPKNTKTLDNFLARLNIGLQIEEDYYLWVNLIAENGNYTYFSNRENSTLNMMLKKNKFGSKKLRYDKSSTGKRNLGLLLKLPKILVLDKVKAPK